MSFLEADGFKYAGQGAPGIFLASSPVVIQAVSSPWGLHTSLGVNSLPSSLSQLLVMPQTAPKCVFQEDLPAQPTPDHPPCYAFYSSVLVSVSIKRSSSARGLHTRVGSECKREAIGTGGDWGEDGHPAGGFLFGSKQSGSVLEELPYFQKEPES